MADENHNQQIARRVLHVVAPAGIGGLERVVQTLAAGQSAAGSDVHVAVVVSHDDVESVRRFSAALTDAGVRVHQLPLSGRAYRRERAAIAWLARDMQAEVVHTHGYRPDVVDGGVARRVGAAAVTTVHGFTGGSARNRLYEWLQTRAFRRFDAVVAVSKPLVRRLVRAGVPENRVHLAVNAWRPFAPLSDRKTARESLGLPAGAFVIGWVGRLSREKGLDVLLDALPLLHDLPMHLAVLGDGPERAPLDARVRAAGLEHKVTWCGTVPDASRLFSALDLFALSSRTEGTPMVLLEAMWARVPIVATNVGGVPDMLGAGEALLVAPESAAALAAAIRELFDRPADAAARASSAHARLERDAAVGPWVGQYGEIYRSALANVAAQ